MSEWLVDKTLEIKNTGETASKLILYTTKYLLYLSSGLQENIIDLYQHYSRQLNFYKTERMEKQKV